ncbi:MAG: hypothetical protein E7314_01415 [Clostridiales bacterium]|nr:hypothetical protein [Clostridiales bacterium]
MTYIILAINIIFLAIGQVLWKFGMNKMSGFNVISIVLNPYIISGVALYGVATLLWLYVLSKEELSLVYPLQSVTYVLGTLFAIFIFHENVSIVRWLGVVTIIIGASLVANG